MNPFRLAPKPVEQTLTDWNALYPAPYDRRAVDPYTRARVILMNGAEFDQVWLSHRISACCADGELRRALALLRRAEQQQQKYLACLKPPEESLLEHTVGHEQLAVDLTAALAQSAACPAVKAALDFALLEDFDHLYRFANLMDMETGRAAEHLVGGYAEIMPGRPTIAQHRHPFDSVPFAAEADFGDRMAVSIVAAAERQTMNFYMNAAGLYPGEAGRRLYQEIGMIEEQHVTRYAGLLDPCATDLERMVLGQYIECYLYYSCMESECDARIRGVWSEMFEREAAHLQFASGLLERFEGKDWRRVIPGGEFPPPLRLISGAGYVRDVLSAQVELTAVRECYVPAGQLPEGSDFERYQRFVNGEPATAPSHRVIEAYIGRYGTDYRFEAQPHPIEALQNRRADSTRVGRPSPATKKASR